MIYVSHRLDEVFEIADRIAVLRDGALVGERLVADTTPEELISLIVGKALANSKRPRPRSKETGSRSAASPSLGAGPVDFDRRAIRNRRAGRAPRGRAGTGRSSLARRIPHAGEIRLDGAPLSLVNPAVSMSAGIGLIARDRVDESEVNGLTIRENVFVNPSAIGRSFASPLSPRSEAAQARAIGLQVGLRPNDPNLPIESLSGGNQQKVIVGRWLRIAGRILIAEDPTAGVDVGAKAEIYRLLDQALETGLSVVVVSTDFEEVARLCHRALVFSRGLIVVELGGDELSIERLIHAASITSSNAA